MRSRTKASLVACSTLALVALGALAHADDDDDDKFKDFKWDRTKVLTVKVGDKFLERGTENVSHSKKWEDGKFEVQYLFTREVTAVEGGVASEEKIFSAAGDYRLVGFGASPTQPDYGDPMGGNFTIKGSGKDCNLTFLKTEHKLTPPEEMGKIERKYLKYRFKESAPQLMSIIEALLPDGPIASNQKWTVDPKKIGKAAWGVEVSAQQEAGEVVGSLTNVRLEDGVHMGHLKVETERKVYDGGITFAKDPETGEDYLPDEHAHNLLGRGWVGLEGDVSLEGSLSLEGTTRWVDVQLLVGWKGTTAKDADQGGNSTQHSWGISYELAKPEKK
jgi:hypothetical protein